jgi:hypothetical protein
MVAAVSVADPERLTVAGDPEKLPVMVNVPLAEPEAVGAKLTLKLQLVFSGTVAGQLSTTENGPVTLHWLIVNG